MKKQTWWDAVCNASNSTDDPVSDIFVLNDDQYEFYESLRDDPLNGHIPAMFSMTTEEQQMYICFMAAFHDEL